MPKRVQRRIHYLFRDADPAPLEVLTAFLSLWFCLVLTWPFDGHKNGPDPAWLWALVAGTGGATKLIGVVIERCLVRLAGLLIGVFFWTVFAIVFQLTVQGGVTWGLYMILACTQVWAIWRIVRP